MIRVGVLGATGYAGAELVRILAGHPGVELTAVYSRQYAGVPFTDIYPSLSGVTDLVCEELSIESACGKADVVFMALPHKLPMELVPVCIRKGVKVIDLSADFRLRDAQVYEAHYQQHTAPDLLAKAVYGLSEINTERIRTADLVANPGCYPTSVLLPLAPLLKANLIDVESIIVDSKSGVSGAGRSPSLTVHFCEVNESLKPYKVATHRHNPEMEEHAGAIAGRPVKITFAPHLVPVTRGMLSTIYTRPIVKIDEDDIQRCIEDFYGGRSFIRRLGRKRMPDMLHVRGSNYCDIGFTLDKSRGCLILASAIDNLIKGAAGQAVQNMNIMLGLDERTGLAMTPFPI
jgi:N-acetyl-gamma-glutamyl-phosphate reductase